ncbi:MAG: acetate--CoA ligase family protein [Phycisphaerae bacterium]|nr:acetate--CoA ligase family protein [Phycisphaerae bacterium]
MARLHEYQGKSALARNAIQIPRGRAVTSPEEAILAAAELNGPVVVKIQAWTTGRAALGGVAFADAPDQAGAHARRMLGMTVGSFPVTHLLVEEKLPIAHEIFVSLSIDDRARAPVMLLAMGGGTGIEERAASVRRIPCDVRAGPDRATLDAALASMPLPPQGRANLARAIDRIFAAARALEARSLEINPLVLTSDGRTVAADCRITVDDYAVIRHPELGIEIARELDHPPTPLETLAYRIEQQDHRGTFFFAQMNAAPTPDSKGLIGFHGAGGGGSMMSMDAITNAGFTIANFCDTSGNPSPAKVYRAARVILAQPGLVGYFGSGSGVANQEQFWSAYGLAKAFWELDLDIPAVIRLGGNTEDRAVDILHSACKAASLRAPVEAYRKSDPPARIAERFASLVADARRAGAQPWTPRPPRRPAFVGTDAAACIPVRQGRLWIELAAWNKNAPAIIARASGLLKDDRGRPATATSPDDFLTKDSESIACEVECRRDGIEGVFVDLDLDPRSA